MAGLGLDPDAAQVRLDKVARDRQAQARAAAALARNLLELLKHALLCRGAPGPHLGRVRARPWRPLLLYGAEGPDLGSGRERQERRDNRVILLAAAVLLLGAGEITSCRAQTDNTAFQLVVVKPGDTLWAIANKYLKDPARWDEILKHNRLPTKDPTIALPGMTLRVPVRLIKAQLRAAHLVYTINRVLARRKDTADWKTGKLSMELFQGDTIRTLDESKARVKLLDKELFSLEQNSMAGLGLDPDAAQVRLDKVARDRQTQARAAAALARNLLELLKHALQMFGGNAVAVVFDAAAQLAAYVGNGDRNRATLGGEFNRISQEVREHAFEHV